MRKSCDARFMHPGSTGLQRVGLPGGAWRQLPHRCDPDSAGYRKSPTILKSAWASSRTSRDGPAPTEISSTNHCQQRRCLPPASPAANATGSNSAPVTAETTRKDESWAAAAPSVVVTGASSGIGRAAAVRLARQVQPPSSAGKASPFPAAIRCCFYQSGPSTKPRVFYPPDSLPFEAGCFSLSGAVET